MTTLNGIKLSPEGVKRNAREARATANRLATGRMNKAERFYAREGDWCPYEQAKLWAAEADRLEAVVEMIECGAREIPVRLWPQGMREKHAEVA